MALPGLLTQTLQDPPMPPPPLATPSTPFPTLSNSPPLLQTVPQETVVVQSLNVPIPEAFITFPNSAPLASHSLLQNASATAHLGSCKWAQQDTMSFGYLDSVADALSDISSPLGTSPISPLPDFLTQPLAPATEHCTSSVLLPGCLGGSTNQPYFSKATTHGHDTAGTAAAEASSRSGAGRLPDSFTHISLQTLVGCSEMLGHTLEDRSGVSQQQDTSLAALIQTSSSVQLRDASQRSLFVVAPLDVLVTRSEVEEPGGGNQFHIIEINGTGISGLTNMPEDVVNTTMASLSEIPKDMCHLPDPVILVASSGQESFPPVSRTLHEKVMYIEALKRGFEAQGRACHITNMARLEKDPQHLSRHSGKPTLVLGYMKQFRRHLQLDASTGRLMMCGRQVHAAINDRFVLNVLHQFNHQVDLHQFTGYNQCFVAGADKGVAYQLYNQFFGDVAADRFGCMAPAMDFKRVVTREELVGEVQARLVSGRGPVVIKPQGTGCGHGIEFFFDPTEPLEQVEAKVDAALQAVASSYDLACGGLPYTVCGYLQTACVTTADSSQGRVHELADHKFEVRIVVYRDGHQLKAFPSIAKAQPLSVPMSVQVARAAFDPSNPDDKSSLINNITTSAKETCQAGSEFMLPLASSETLKLLGITVPELQELCCACTAFIRYVLDQVQDQPELFDLPARQ